MSGRDAYEEEMAFRRRITDEDGERLLAGLGSDSDQGPEPDEVVHFLRAVSAAVPVQPDPAVEPSLVRRLAETARSASHEASTVTLAASRAGTGRKSGESGRRARKGGTWRPRLALAAKVAVAVALVPASMAGLAFAGVTLPEPAQEAMERVGLDLPNQSAVEEDFSVTDDEDAGDDATEPSRGQGATPSARSDRAGDRGKSASRGHRGRRAGKGGRPAGQRAGERSRGSGEPQLGAPAPVIPPPQGGDVPAGGGSPGRAEPQGAGPSGGVPPGQGKRRGPPSLDEP